MALIVKKTSVTEVRVMNALGSATIVGDSPVHERADMMMSSRARHVKPGLNMGGPSSKAKYSRLTKPMQTPNTYKCRAWETHGGC